MFELPGADSSPGIRFLLFADELAVVLYCTTVLAGDSDALVTKILMTIVYLPAINVDTFKVLQQNCYVSSHVIT